MKLSVRKVYLTIGAGMSLFLFFLYLGILFISIWISKTIFSMESMYLWTVIITGCSATFSVIGGFGFRRLFQRMSSLEIYFFLLFLVTLSFDSVRILNWVLLLRQSTPYFGNLVTRIVYFGYFLGLLFLFTSSIYSGEVSYQKTGTLLIILGTLAFALSYSLPIDITSIEPNLLFRVGVKEYLLLVRIGLMGLTVMSFAHSAFLARSKEGWAICAAVLVLLVGREIVFYHTETALGLAGVFLIIVGSYYFSRKSYLKHLWI